MPEKKRCPHPQAQRTPVAEADLGTYGYMDCGKCGARFLPRGTATRHGTYRGYARHGKARKGEWGWPIGNCGCREAGKSWRQAYAQRPAAQEATRKRGRARLAALYRLRKMHPGEYNAIYTEEVLKAGGNAQPPPVPQWDIIFARLVQSATGRREAEVADRLRHGLASRQETEVMRQVSRLRTVMDALLRQGENGGST